MPGQRVFWAEKNARANVEGKRYGKTIHDQLIFYERWRINDTSQKKKKTNEVFKEYINENGETKIECDTSASKIHRVCVWSKGGRREKEKEQEQKLESRFFYGRLAFNAVNKSIIGPFTRSSPSHNVSASRVFYRRFSLSCACDEKNKLAAKP